MTPPQKTPPRKNPPMTSAPVAAPERHLGALASVVGAVTLLAGFVVVPGPDVDDVAQGGWAPGHLLTAVGFLLLAIGLPAIASSLGPRLGVTGTIGYVAVLTRFVLSTGSHLYSLWILPTLAGHPELNPLLVTNGGLASIYAGHGDLINAVLAVGMLGLAYALARTGRGSRIVAAFVAVAAVAEFIGFPLSLVLLAVTSGWLGARLLVRGDVTTALRRTR